MKKGDQLTRIPTIPILGYILRKINENRKDIETTLKTKKETESEPKNWSFLWILKGSSNKRFNALKLKK